ncbi:MAG: aminoglycoside phosphotransferase family protein [Acidobacteriota bacterium]
MAAQDMPAAEVEITEDLVHSLLLEQHPDLAHEPLVLVANGWDNVIFRLGSELVVRLPRRQLGADLVEHEHRWLPQLAARLPIPIAAPVRTGTPSDDYPWAWSICPWFEGGVAADVTLTDAATQARRLGEFVAAFHTPAPDDAPDNPYRGQPMAYLRPRIAANLERLRTVVDADRVSRRADDLLDVDDWAGPPIWLHGDLHSANIVVRDGAIVAVLDLGDVTSGDPACDLAVAWMLFDDAEREIFRDAAGASLPVDDATWQRGQAWGLHFALLYLLHSADNERFARMGTRLLAAVDP